MPFVQWCSGKKRMAKETVKRDSKRNFQEATPAESLQER